MSHIDSARIVRDMPAAEYHTVEAVGGTALRDILRSPLHFYARHVDPNRTRHETPAMRLGTLAHACILEPDRWISDFIVKPEGIDRRTKDGKEAWAAFEAGANGREIIPADAANCAEGMARAVRSHPAASRLLKGAATEVSVMWADGVTGVRCKGRLDAVSSFADIIVDLKTCQDASPDAFAKHVANYAYHIQAAHYLDGFEAATGDKAAGYVWIAVEKEPPHAVAVYTADAEMLERGRSERLKALDLIATCRHENKWPGYPVEVQTISLPGWY